MKKCWRTIFSFVCLWLLSQVPAVAETRTILFADEDAICSVEVIDSDLGEATRYSEDQLAGWEDLFGIDREEWRYWGAYDDSEIMYADLPYGRLMNAIWTLKEVSRNDSCNLGPACWLLTVGFDFAAEEIDTVNPDCNLSSGTGAMNSWTLFGGNGAVTISPATFYETFPDLTSVLIHEARHSDGPSHVDCERRPGDDLYCDQRFDDLGSYAFGSWFRVLVYYFDVKLSYYERHYSGAIANAELSDRFNEDPGWRVDLEDPECILTFYEIPAEQFAHCHDWMTNFSDGSGLWGAGMSTNEYDLAMLATSRVDNELLFSGRFKEREGYVAGDLLNMPARHINRLLKQFDLACTEDETIPSDSDCRVYQYITNTDYDPNTYRFEENLTDLNFPSWNDQMIRNGFKIADISLPNDIALEGHTRFAAVWHRNAETDFRIDLTATALEDLLEGIGDAPRPILDFETYVEMPNGHPGSPQRFFAVVWQKNNPDIKSHLEYDLTREALQSREESLKEGGWELVRMESYYLPMVDDEEILYAGIWHKNIPLRDRPQLKLDIQPQKK